MAVLRSSSLPRATRRPRFKAAKVTAELQLGWTEAVPEGAWNTYREAIRVLQAAGIRFLLGGGFALATFVGRWRDTKDIDLYIHPSDREPAVRALQEASFEDYYSRLPYDRNWIYRSTKNDLIVDIIWAMANQRAQVDEKWFERAATFRLRGESLGLIPLEEFLWCKFYILQRDHCDWIDILNVLYKQGEALDWGYLLDRLGDDTELLSGLLCVYKWMCPDGASRLPAGVWRELGLPRPKGEEKLREDRVRLLDSRAWFAALQPQNGKLEV